jgi:outer membrane lipoprotein-sorting protein
MNGWLALLSINLAGVFLGFLSHAPANLEDKPSGFEVMKKVDWLLHGRSQYGILQMTVSRPGINRTLRVESWLKDEKYAFVRTLAPPREAGTSTLRIGSEMWNYLPRVERTLKISPSMLGQGWMGSDATNEDILKASSILQDYDHRVTGIEDVEGQRAYRIESVPKPGAAVVWGRLTYLVRVSDGVPLRQEFWNESNQIVKTIRFSAFRQIGERLFPAKWEIRPLKEEEGRSTLIEYERIVFDQPIDEKIFTLQNLKSVR